MSEHAHEINWPEKAEALLARVGPSSLHGEVMAYLRTLEGKPLLVACSGGADSIFLLCVLDALSAEMGYKLIVAHYNHRWRSEASAQDADFVKTVADALKLPFVIGERPPKEAAFTETTARGLRLNFLRDVADKRGCTAIALGHQQDDILETMLIRIARGAGVDGLAAPRPISQFEQWPAHLRPLLELSAGSIREDLEAEGIPWREDSSNTDIRIARNALRQEVIPALSDCLSHDVQMGAARSRMLLEEDAAALDALTRAQFPKAFTMVESLDRKHLQAAPRSLVRRALNAWFSSHELIGSVGAPAMDLILRAIYDEKATNRFSVGAHYLELDMNTLSIDWSDREESGLEHTQISPGDSALLSTGAQLCSDLVELDAATSARIFSGKVDPSCEVYLRLKATDTLEIRSWEPGDRFLPMGAPGRKKLKDWFIDRHIPRRERKRLPLVLDDAGEILWVPGLPPAEAYRIMPDTKLALRLTYQSRRST
jgi:tRNA(Ile)-lysidine synthase